VVITGSTASILTAGGKRNSVGNFIEYDENDWNEAAINATATPEKDANASGGDRYRASKTLAERGRIKLSTFGLSLTSVAARDFVREHKTTLKWDLAVLNPPFVSYPSEAFSYILIDLLARYSEFVSWLIANNYSS
jgi:hypothetical protein